MAVIQLSALFMNACMCNKFMQFSVNCRNNLMESLLESLIRYPFSTPLHNTCSFASAYGMNQVHLKNLFLKVQSNKIIPKMNTCTIKLSRIYHTNVISRLHRSKFNKKMSISNTCKSNNYRNTFTLKNPQKLMFLSLQFPLFTSFGYGNGVCAIPDNKNN